MSFGTSMAQLYDVRLDGSSFLMTNVSLSNALVAGTIGKDEFIDHQALKVFYQSRHDQPYWVGTLGPKSHAKELLGVLENAWTHGLNPAHYHVEEIRALIEKPGFTPQLELELTLTDAFIRYARDLSGIRVDPSSLKVDGESWRQPKSAHDVLALLRSGRNLENILQSVEPQGRTYKLLQQELVRLSRLGDEPYASVLPISFGDSLMRPPWRHKSIPDLRLRLGAVQQTHDALLYDDALAAAVMKFQRENGLMDDGVIGSNTLRALNRTRQSQILQIVANMERLRWVDENKPEKFVVVNIPSATLWAINDGQVQFEMPVVVGKPVRATQSFIAEIKGVRFNPDWTVPPTIKKYDILPKIQEDPEYLTNKGIELIRGRGANRETLDPDAVDWENITWQELNAIEMVQIPGEHNPLGKIRILMPNEFNIYLHDTNHPEHFDLPERAQSSGCVRLKDPEQMARFVMEGQEGWSDSRMDELLGRARTTDIPISNSIPVYVLYYTVWTDDQGQIVYGTDIYNQDRKLTELLAEIDGFQIPRHNQSTAARSGSSELVSIQ